ncbi:MAG: hypothetical protein M3246_07070 [Actinomycetota bacterium]|nr:hypothetical protein [Actinomycetota bacterium]
MKKLMLLAAILALALVAAAPVIAQEAKIEGGPKAKAEKGKADAFISEDVKAKAEPGKAEAKAGGAEAKAKAKAPPPPPPPPPPPKALPPTGGGIAGTASLVGLGAGALLVAGGLIARRIIR